MGMQDIYCRHSNYGTSPNNIVPYTIWNILYIESFNPDQYTIFSYLQCKVQKEEDGANDEGGQGRILDVLWLIRILIACTKVPVCSLHNPSMEDGEHE